jgi:Fe2+ or Zn2+ uptake regulation protein
MRKSPQRSRILEIIKESESHPTADELYHELRKEFPRISLGTVYRNVRQLVSEGLIQELPVIGGASRFDGEASPHAHFVCRRCGHAFDLHDIEVCGLVEGSMTGRGDRVEKLIVELHGVCRNCARGGESH